MGLYRGYIGIMEKKMETTIKESYTLPQTNMETHIAPF